MLSFYLILWDIYGRGTKRGGERGGGEGGVIQS